MKNENAWKGYTPEDLAELDRICEFYKDCLNKGKTERECTALSEAMAREAGYCTIDELTAGGRRLMPGDKIYGTCMKKTIALIRLGERPISEGMNILGAHIDSPRLDIKQNPLYETEEMALMDTHYYGGIKKYQWVTTPMAIHGVVAKKDGSVVNVCIGEDPSDPVFVVTDLLIHLASKQMSRQGTTVVEGEKLDVLVGSRPLTKEEGLDDDEKEAVKAGILKLLEEKYGMEEADFLSAELEVVPAGKASDCGLDRSMIIAYGQDDKVCAFTSLLAMLEVTESARTAACLLVDKEEIGSVGATGMQSEWFENFVAEVVAASEGESMLKTRRALAGSRMLSSDVSAAFDPLYADVFEKRSSAFMGHGISFNKFTGRGGKSGSNDANAEFVAGIRRVMDEAGVTYQFTELGKVDAGGGGTIAYIMADHGMEVIDSGVAVLNMHSPYEVSSKSDIYEAVKCYKAFLNWE